MSDHSVSACSSWKNGANYYEARCSCGWIVTPDSLEACFTAQADHLHAHGLKTREERMAERDVVHVFSNGTEYMAWSERNCESCALGYDVAPQGWKCPIEKAIGEAMFDSDTGMDRELAIRGGLATWPHRDCPEKVVKP